VKPTKSGSLFFNYKQFFSIVILAVADAKYNFLYADVGSYGKVLDSLIFQNCTYNKKLQNGDLNIPKGKPLPGIDLPAMPHVFVGDEAFSLSQYVLRPYSRKFLTHTKRIFNYRLTTAQRYVECSFRILSNKWRILHRPLNVKSDLAASIVIACCILHNYVLQRDGYKFEDTLTVKGFHDTGEKPEILQGGNNLNQMRNIWANYFVSDVGSLPWQDNCI
jgi:hypothetical protein